VDGRLFVISGPSGVGKGTIQKALREALPDLFWSVSATTRAPRAGEAEGKDYFFLSEADFRTMIERDQLLEYARVYQHYYGTPVDFVAKHLHNGCDVLLEIDIQGALQVKRKMPEAALVFIAPPSAEALQERLASRALDSEDAIALRLAASAEELKYINEYDYVVRNSRLETAVDQVRAIVVAERCRVVKEVRGIDANV
jgi:guanylate kinase